MTDAPNFDQKDQTVTNQTNIYMEKNPPQPDPAPAFPIPQQIPAYPLDFTGREDEIRVLVEQFGQGATITGLRGMGGVGKTALALVLADQLKVRFPDGQLFLNMQGTSKSTLKPEEAMAHVIRSYLGVDASLPEQSNSLSGLYRSILSDKKALILMDNAASREQVEPLLPPPSCALLVTSRNKFALPGLAEKDLDVLPLGDARKLLLEICGRIGENAEELAKLCGCLPIALRNAAYALKEKPNLSPEGYVKRLGDAKKRLELVEASFSTSYDLLTPELQRLWSMLSVFPADFDSAGAAAVWEMKEMPTEDALGELISWSLVDFLPSVKGEGGRFKLHDLARDFSSSRLDIADSEPSNLRHARHFMKVLSNADKLFNQGGESQILGLDLFEKEWPNIREGLLWAEICPQLTPEIDSIRCDYPNAGASILLLRWHSQELIKWYKIAVEAAQRLKNRNLIAASLGGMANAQIAIGNSSEAIGYLNQALKISRVIGDRRGYGTNLAGLGKAYSSLGQNRKAIEYYEEALLISKKTSDKNEIASGLAALGRAHANLGENHKAIDYYENALSMSRQIQDISGEASNLAALGRAYVQLGKARKAIEYYEKALPISQKIKNQRGEAANLAALGGAYANLGEARKAIEYYEKALPISRATNNKNGEAANLAALGRAYADLGDFQNSFMCFREALAIAREIGDRKGESATLISIGQAYAALDEQLKAIEYYDQALKVSRGIGYRPGEGNSLFNTSLSMDKLSQRENAIDLAKSALSIFEQIESPHAETVRQKLAEWGA